MPTCQRMSAKTIIVGELPKLAFLRISSAARVAGLVFWVGYHSFKHIYTAAYAQELIRAPWSRRPMRRHTLKRETILRVKISRLLESSPSWVSSHSIRVQACRCKCTVVSKLVGAASSQLQPLAAMAARMCYCSTDYTSVIKVHAVIRCSCRLQVMTPAIL